ncbi:hypothetical protein SAMN06265173_1547 [Thalassovita litoralis]|jgi:5-methylcytosine-specific restriction endonuclease McrA|uniref:HNH nuclease domain-containing protein n=1 Tax=Thalassovita litoralis TaxID=1010611 RepID=A0A521FV91_9RHOB|nr:HNH endonuclease [Thalassovita litoralis]SMO99451.1 hypothetical protein SAMN06265173_1547 [Thalassovita litoralis]
MGVLKGRGLPGRLSAPRSRIAPVSDQTLSGGHDVRRSKNWLNTARWQRLRLRVLERDGYTCQKTGVLLSGKHPAPNSPVVDHIVPHRGDPGLFWDQSNLQSVSKAWHDSVKQSIEKRGEAGQA